MPLPAPEEVVQLYEQLGKVFQQHRQSPCGKLAAAASGFVDQHQAALAKMRPGAVAAVEQHAELAPRLRTALEAVMTGSIRCRQHEQLLAVRERLRKLQNHTAP